MKKPFLLAMLAYLLPTFPLGYAWHLVTFKDAYDRLDMYRAEVIIPFGLASMLLQAAIYAGPIPSCSARGAMSGWRARHASLESLRRLPGHSRHCRSRLNIR